MVSAVGMYYIMVYYMPFSIGLSAVCGSFVGSVGYYCGFVARFGFLAIAIAGMGTAHQVVKKLAIWSAFGSISVLVLLLAVCFDLVGFRFGCGLVWWLKSA